jgi:hypothetical protein
MTNPSSTKVFLGRITASQLGSGVMVTKWTILPFFIHWRADDKKCIVVICNLFCS